VFFGFSPEFFPDLIYSGTSIDVVSVSTGLADLGMKPWSFRTTFKLTRLQQPTGSQWQISVNGRFQSTADFNKRILNCYLPAFQ